MDAQTSDFSDQGVPLSKFEATPEGGGLMRVASVFSDFGSKWPPIDNPQF